MGGALSRQDLDPVPAGAGKPAHSAVADTVAQNDLELTGLPIFLGPQLCSNKCD